MKRNWKSSNQSWRSPTQVNWRFFDRRRALGLGVGLDDGDELVRQKKPVFIDFEASSLSQFSWPIEVGIAWLEGKRVVSESKLIHPRPEWPEDDWNPVSEEVHGIPRADLDGANSADDVVSWLLEAIAGRTLVSDAPEFDQRWLDRLLGGPGPQIDDFDRVLWMAFSHEDGTIAPGRLNKAYKNRLTRQTIHRAGDDAAGLCYAWRAGLGK